MNAPATTQAVSFSLEVQWRNSAGAVIGTTTVKTYVDDTAGAWNQASLVMTAPTGATGARILLVQRGLGATVYTDDLVFK